MSVNSSALGVHKRLKVRARARSEATCWGHGYVAQAGKKWSSVTCCNQWLIASGVVIKISGLRWWVKVLSASECLVSWAGAAHGYARVAPEERAG
ncbi:MAG: hypothetical protein ACYDD9_06445 [Acidithiobacillus sp.]